MSTDARRASIPPRPEAPPRPAHAPDTTDTGTPDDATAQDTANPGTTAQDATAPGATAPDTAAAATTDPGSARAATGAPRTETGPPAPSAPTAPPAPTGPTAPPAPRRPGARPAPAPRPDQSFTAEDWPPTSPRPQWRRAAEQRPADHDVRTPPPRTQDRPPAGQWPTPSRRSPDFAGGRPVRPRERDGDATPAGSVGAPAPGAPWAPPARRPGGPDDGAASPDGSHNGTADSGGPPSRAPRVSPDTVAPGPAGAPDTDPDVRDADGSVPPPPAASARFPDGPPPAARTTGPPGGTDPDTTRLRPVPARSPGEAPRPARPFVSFARPQTPPETGAQPYGDPAAARPGGARHRSRVAAAAACVVLGLGLIGGAATGSWLTGDSAAAGSAGAFTAAGELWHGVPVDRLFPPTVRGDGAGPGGADRTWTRIAVAPDSGCRTAFDPLLRKALAPVGCLRLLRATYTDATRSHVTTVGLLFTEGDEAAMRALKSRFGKEGLGDRTDLMPRPYAAKGTVAAGFGDRQRATWTLSVLTDAPVVVYAVSGFADGRTVRSPQPAEKATESGATSAPAQSGLGHEARGLADRIERSFRKTVAKAVEDPS
ncbi:hypothetical protein ACFY93_03720 [Streptomyces sp. NPDC008313]|uniref:hypothetical protein n=1 Tax=Streptomyces sp. NPDC008313 TaxID=3364826 RepID=UPI0036E8D9F1